MNRTLKILLMAAAVVFAASGYTAMRNDRIKEDTAIERRRLKDRIADVRDRVEYDRRRISGMQPGGSLDLAMQDLSKVEAELAELERQEQALPK